MSGPTLLTAGLFGQMLTCDAGDIAPVYVAIEGSCTDCPFMGLLFLTDDNIYRNSVFDLLGNICGEAVVVAQLYFWPFCGGLAVCVVLCDFGRVAAWTAGSFRAKIFSPHIILAGRGHPVFTAGHGFKARRIAIHIAHREAHHQ